METEGLQDIRRRYGLNRVVPPNPQEILANLDLETFARVMPRPERSSLYRDLDTQTDDATRPEIERSAFFNSITGSGEVLIPIEVDAEGHLLDGFRRVAISRALGIDRIPVVVLTGWRGDPLRVLELKRSYIREVNATTRHLGLSERRDMAKALLGADEQRFRAGEVQSRQSYGLIAAQCGLSQHTVENLERDEYYLRYRSRCEGEQRLRGDERLRATSPIPPERRLDVNAAWRRGFGDISPRRSLSGLEDAAKKRRKELGQLPEGLDRDEKLALLEDSIAVLTPRMEELEKGKEGDRLDKEKRAEERAKREAEYELSRKQRLVQDFTGDLLVLTEGDSRSVSFATLVENDRDVEQVVTALNQGGKVAYRSAVSLGADGALQYEAADLTEQSLRRLVQRVREEGVVKAGENTWPVRTLADARLLRHLLDRREAGEVMALEVVLDGRVVARRNADQWLLLQLHRQLNKSSVVEAAAGEGTDPDTEGGHPEGPDQRIAQRKPKSEEPDALAQLMACCIVLEEIERRLEESGRMSGAFEEWDRLTDRALGALRGIRRRVPELNGVDWPSSGF